MKNREVIAKVVRKERESIPSPGGEGSRMRASLYPKGPILSFAISSQNPKIQNPTQISFTPPPVLLFSTLLYRHEADPRICEKRLETHVVLTFKRLTNE